MRAKDFSAVVFAIIAQGGEALSSVVCQLKFMSRGATDGDASENTGMGHMDAHLRASDPHPEHCVPRVLARKSAEAMMRFRNCDEAAALRPNGSRDTKAKIR